MTTLTQFAQNSNVYGEYTIVLWLYYACIHIVALSSVCLGLKSNRVVWVAMSMVYSMSQEEGVIHFAGLINILRTDKTRNYDRSDTKQEIHEL